MTFDELNFVWDESVNSSNRLYETPISYSNGNTFEPIKYTAKELIEIEIYKAKNEIEFCDNERENLNKLILKHKRIKQFNKIYKNDIEPMDFLGLCYSDELELKYEQLEVKFIEKEKKLELKIKDIQKDIRTKVFTIKRICLENVSLILKIDGVKRFKDSAGHILSKNGIEITDKKKHKNYQINNYKQILPYCKVLPKVKLPLF